MEIGEELHAVTPVICGIEGEEHEIGMAGLLFSVDRFEIGHFAAAWAAPGSPDVDPDRVSREAHHDKGRAVCVCQWQGREPVTDLGERGAGIGEATPAILPVEEEDARDDGEDQEERDSQLHTAGQGAKRRDCLGHCRVGCRVSHIVSSSHSHTKCRIGIPFTRHRGD